MRTVKVLGADWCSDCRRSKRLLDRPCRASEDPRPATRRHHQHIRADHRMTPTGAGSQPLVWRTWPEAAWLIGRGVTFRTASWIAAVVGTLLTLMGLAELDRSIAHLSVCGNCARTAEDYRRLAAALERLARRHAPDPAAVQRLRALASRLSLGSSDPINEEF